MSAHCINICCLVPVHPHVSVYIGRDFGARARVCKNLAADFLEGLAGKGKLVVPVKDRGNSNFKKKRFKAAIADYSTAIRLWYVTASESHG